MAQKKSYLTVTDQFCGAGGSSQGAKKVLDKIGGEIRLALNHWKLAIETHNTNFPDTLHDCTDISACDPRRYPSTDILITSPECTNHSVASGKKQVKKQLDMFDKGIIDAAAERSRATMWDVPRFAEFHNYNVIITENVVDARKWIMFDSWIHAMQALGYDFKCCFLNSMHFFPTPQSRDRMYVVFWKKGNKAPDLNYMPLANCSHCATDVNAVQSWKPRQKSWKYRTGYVYCCPKCSKIVEPYYYAAFNCIDWSVPSQRIGDRKKPLVAKTERRIKYGLKKYGNEPFVFPSSYSDQARGIVKPVSNPLLTQTTFAGSQAVVQPFIINNQHSTGIDFRVKGTADPLQCLTTDHSLNLLTPFIVKSDNVSQGPSSYVRKSSEPFQTHVTRQTFGLVHGPIIVENKGQSLAKSAVDPMGAITSIRNQGIITSEAFNSFISYYNNGSDQHSHITKAFGTVTTGDRLSMVNYSNTNYEDCYYRTIKAHEVKLAMAFEKDYIIKGNAKEQVMQCGNAVTPPAMSWLIEQTTKTLLS